MQALANAGRHAPNYTIAVLESFGEPSPSLTERSLSSNFASGQLQQLNVWPQLTGSAWKLEVRYTVLH
jgi:hypothetical protein